MVSAPPRFNLGHSGTIHLLPSTQEKFTILCKNFRAVVQNRSAFRGLSTSLPTHGDPRIFWEQPYPAANMSQLLISKNCMSQFPLCWELKIVMMGAFTPRKLVDASKQRNMAPPSCRNPVPPCSLLRLPLSFLPLHISRLMAFFLCLPLALIGENLTQFSLLSYSQRVTNSTLLVTFAL